MDANNFLQIKYNAFFSNDTIEDFNDMEIFKEELNHYYSNHVKANVVGRGGGAYEFNIHFICDLFLQEYIKIIAGYLLIRTVNKVTDKIIEKYLFSPLKRIYQKLKGKNPILDCYSFQIEFKDVSVFIYKTSQDSIFSNLDKILQRISENIKNLEKVEGYKVTEIYIPAVLDVLNNQKLYRAPLGIQETNHLTSEDYFNIWGIKYLHGQLSTVL